eukprot:TRINITY_DN29108_c0_g1_i4.p1 TRINITY_DN29108_c0_g1~~TRINITY_DN29108_c0_g1_i4.p1  ORF type:complete len:366 (+),score=22.70 TRINITY_DN29108_c0_g1_i4:258-1355(+)
MGVRRQHCALRAHRALPVSLLLRPLVDGLPRARGGHGRVHRSLAASGGGRRHSDDALGWGGLDQPQHGCGRRFVPRLVGEVHRRGHGRTLRRILLCRGRHCTAVRGPHARLLGQAPPLRIPAGYSPRAVFSAAAVGPGVVVLGVYAVLSLCCRRRGDSGAAPQRQPSVTRAGSAAAAPPPPGRSALAIDEKWDALLSTAPLVASLASCYAVHYTTKAALFVHLAPAAGAGGLYATAPKHGFYVHYTSAERIASFSGRLLARRLPAVTAGCFVALQLLSLAALFLCVLSQGALRDHLPFALDAPLWALVAAAAWVGALNGVAYVSILLMVRRAAGPRAAEFVLGVASGADDLGIMLASAWSVPLSH